MDQGREGRRCRCGTCLARDNSSEWCAVCQRTGQGGGPLGPPLVPDEFWEHPAMRDALVSRHMGRVIRAFREHSLHGREPISQSTVAGWMGITQAQVSRIETGAPMVDLDRLTDWALLLGVPEAYLWFKLPDADGAVKRSQFLQLGGLTVAGIVSPGLLGIQSATSLTARECAQWLAWELWQRGELALHATDLPLSIARYLRLVDTNGRLVVNLNLISPDGHIICDKDGYCSFVHPSFTDFYVAQRIFANIAIGDSKLLAAAQTTHATDLIIQEFVLRHQSSAGFLADWMAQGANAVVRVNSAGILAKVSEPTTIDAVVSTLKADPDSRQLYLTAVSSRVLALEWGQATQLAARIEHGIDDGGPDLTDAQLALLANELTNPRDGAARWCSTVLLGHFYNRAHELTRSAFHQALQDEPCSENLRAIGAVLAGNNPLTV
ncbi:MAG: helix-turn-helix domain-containing protein [Actinobacteria bacterium]|nr:helix-turn-helix domain-containing protein [Actinomycetota bacterium]